jgi:hypothetical protein
MRRLAVTISFLTAALWANSAYAAICIFGVCLGGGGDSGGGTSAAPEIDGAGALSAAVLVVTVGALVYRRLNRR